ncbi:hypothetical protein P8452_02097 [Trifolium repens]|nr:hypothetical protein P8452_02097 [Trifolium repens]
MSNYCSPPKFFKIIQNHELENGELRVPKKFVEKYWNGIPNPVAITLPNGVQQELVWVKRDGDIWFRKNWEKIAKYLKFGFVVYFKYMGGSCFQLEIFGLDCLEIDYSNIKFKRKAQEFIQMSDESDDDSDAGESQIHKQFQRTQNGKRKFSCMNKKAKKYMKAETNVASTSKRRKSGVTNNNYPSFELKLRRTYAQGYLFRIPIAFSRTYMKGFDGIASVRVIGKNRIWKLSVKYDCVTKHSVVNGGWHPFTKENNLQIGDVCKFEMIREDPLTFVVTIIRTREEPRHSHLRGYKKVKSEGPGSR